MSRETHIRKLKRQVAELERQYPVGENRMPRNPSSPVHNPLVSYSKLTIDQLSDWAAGYILVAVGRGDFRQSVDAMVRQAYANGYNAKAAEATPRRPRKRRSRRV